MKIVIRAGGVGSRLWPVSRQRQPKQFHALTSELTMLEEAIQRVIPVAAAEDIFISTNEAAAQSVHDCRGPIPKENIIIEPFRKDTAAAIGLESIAIRKRDPEAIIASLGSDHSVKRSKEFQRVLKIAEQFVMRHPECIVPIGVRPTHPDVGYGYIECGELVDTEDGKNLWQVNSFKEKPDLKTAKEFISQANYLWNANMFVWKVSTILELYERFLPEMYEQLLIIEAALGTPDEKAVINRIYPKLDKIAVDYAIIEKAENKMAMAADVGWSDIGDWARLKDEVAESEAENVVIGAEHVNISTENSLIYSDIKGKIIATVNVENLVIVDTADALLICDKYSSGKVKEVVEWLQEHKRDDLL
ncbi:MAG: mannose-1-phosphate guanylyltransferase [Candidatus Kerfeldbacteria bacterium CG15_BIG_FIL_POST_REV_8_21_14_020_45_12]|uniref:Mannose-1-phosphate guanylyltransferase n=1 Tax=Candidatus Kerfeldbacteria bacterium CG15_BIG_FIL_POST_REV_8_21_14_020_45_12 TaxID=2014247 RepID=A0A2M7H484_9BACT|nr:MAG: mannose-1-phosphate guanylyltransferase [Candidatus Kerfeldbacteria bacterium CG15_BIG_FIL_POST_REV_8_21_14_020_45_12]